MKVVDNALFQLKLAGKHFVVRFIFGGFLIFWFEAAIYLFFASKIPLYLAALPILVFNVLGLIFIPMLLPKEKALVPAVVQPKNVTPMSIDPMSINPKVFLGTFLISAIAGTAAYSLMRRR